MHIFHTVGYMNKLMDNNNLEQEFERSNAIVDYMWWWLAKILWTLKPWKDANTNKKSDYTERWER